MPYQPLMAATVPDSGSRGHRLTGGPLAEQLSGSVIFEDKDRAGPLIILQPSR